MKKIIVCLLLIGILLSLGCNRLKRPDIDYPVSVDYHKGTKGLVIEKVDNLPPDEIMEGSDFVIGVELKNKGAVDIQEAIVTLYGFEGGYVSINNPQYYVDIPGSQPGFPEGGYEILNFEVKNNEIPEVVKTYTAAYTVSAYYRYKTEVASDVCINPNLYSYVKTKETVCEPKEITISGGQGAPVAVTKIEQSFTPYQEKIKANFLITFANKGDGEVAGKVHIGDVRLANVPISCNQDSVTLKEKEEKSVLCSGEILLSSGTYIAPLAVDLIYDYISRLDEKVKIRSIRDT